MDRTRIEELMAKFQQGELSRRGFIRQATALGISAGAAGMLAGSVVAQDVATPEASPVAGASPVGEVVSIAPISREDFYKLLWEQFPLEQPQTQGGQVIYGQTTDIDTMNLLIASDVYSSEWPATSTSTSWPPTRSTARSCRAGRHLGHRVRWPDLHLQDQPERLLDRRQPGHRRRRRLLVRHHPGRDTCPRAAVRST